jgi:hypothetical protein
MTVLQFAIPRQISQRLDYLSIAQAAWRAKVTTARVEHNDRNAGGNKTRITCPDTMAPFLEDALRVIVTEATERGDSALLRDAEVAIAALREGLTNA